MPIDSVLALSGHRNIDLLKLDVEGAEKEIFSVNYENWLPYTKVIMIELHDRFKHGCSKAFFSAVAKYDFSFSIRGENCILVNNAYEDAYRNTVEARREACLRNRLQRYTWYFRDMAVKNRAAYMKDFFGQNGISHVALYGLTEISRGLMPMLKDMGIVIDYAVEEYRIDRETKVISRNAKEFPPTDCMIICDLRVSSVRQKLTDMHVGFRIFDLYEIVGDSSEHDEKNLY